MSAREVENQKPADYVRKRLHKNLEKDEADYDGLDENEKGIELVITFVLCDRSDGHANDKKCGTNDVW